LSSASLRYNLNRGLQIAFHGFLLLRRAKSNVRRLRAQRLHWRRRAVMLQAALNTSWAILL
jgi:hypothetical protein